MTTTYKPAKKQPAKRTIIISPMPKTLKPGEKRRLVRK